MSAPAAPTERRAPPAPGAAPTVPSADTAPDTAPDAEAGAARSGPHSLFGEILDWMLAPLLLLWPMSIFLTYLVAQGIADRPYDRELGVVVRAIAQQAGSEAVGVGGPAPKLRLRMPSLAGELLRADEAGSVYFRVLGPRGEHLAGDRGLPQPDDELPIGELRFRDAMVRDEPVRVATMRVARSDADAADALLVQVAETLEKRSRLANEIIKGVILPQFVILPLAVQQRIRRRDSTDLSPIDARDVPDEVAPLVGAINELLTRLDQSIRTQKQFLADAAHQLKTPLAGLRMQAELAGREIDTGASDAASLKRSLRQIAASSQRAAHMVNQLLAMARAEDREQALRKQQLNLASIVKDTVRDFVPKAMDQRIDLGYEGPDDDAGVRLQGQPVLVREMVRNLVDNALQYTPGGGTVTARVVADPFGQVVVLQVEDNGPGIAEAEREAVFQPFYRPADTLIEGSGLGLAIVREVAEQHGATITIDDALPRALAAASGSGPGTLITVRFPVRPA